MLKIREIRNKKKLTQDQVVEITGIKKRSYVDYENGKVDVPFSKLQNIARCLGASIAEIVGETEELQEQVNSGLENSKEGFIPLIPIDAMAGYGAGEMVVSDNDIMDYYKVPDFDSLKADFIIKISGDSMEPSYRSGDMLACRKIKDSSFFVWGRTYLLNTDQGPLLKRLFEVQDDKHMLKCVSDNNAYPPFTIPKTSIYDLSIIVGLVRTE
ncbi:MAG: XRE family transcriptional regulator [Prolixibacteraceae bacterium]